MLPQIRTILCATDLSPRAPEIFRYAMGLAQSCGAKIVLVHAVEPLSPFAKSMVDLYVTKEQNEQLHRQAYDRLLEALGEKLELFCRDELCTDPQGRDRVTDIRIVEGRPSEVVVAEAAKAKADLIVMGSHGHSAVGEILLGSTAHQVTLHAPVPVLLVRLPKS